MAAQHPDVVKRLKMLADQQAATLCDGSEKGPGVRPSGRVAEPEPLYPMTTGKAKKTKLPAKEKS